MQSCPLQWKANLVFRSRSSRQEAATQRTVLGAPRPVEQAPPGLPRFATMHRKPASGLDGRPTARPQRCRPCREPADDPRRRGAWDSRCDDRPRVPAGGHDRNATPPARSSHRRSARGPRQRHDCRDHAQPHCDGQTVHLVSLLAGLRRRVAECQQRGGFAMNGGVRLAAPKVVHRTYANGQEVQRCSGSSNVVAVAAVADVAKAKEFYEGTLGLQPLEIEEPGGVLYACGGGSTAARLRVALRGHQPGHRGVVAGRGHRPGGCRPGRQGRELRALRATGDHARGRYPHPRRPEGAWFKDPDGNILNLVSRGEGTAERVRGATPITVPMSGASVAADVRAHAVRG